LRSYLVAAENAFFYNPSRKKLLMGGLFHVCPGGKSNAFAKRNNSVVEVQRGVICASTL